MSSEKGIVTMSTGEELKSKVRRTASGCEPHPAEADRSGKTRECSHGRKPNRDVAARATKIPLITVRPVGADDERTETFSTLLCGRPSSGPIEQRGGVAIVGRFADSNAHTVENRMAQLNWQS